MIRYKTYIKSLLFILLIAGLFGFANHRNAVRKIVAIEVEFEKGDNLFITRNEVDKLLIQSLGNVKNKTKESLFLKVLEQNIEQNDMVENAEVYVTIGGVLKTKVLQRKPVARIVVNGSSYYLDSKGKKMTLSKNYSARVPIVRGVLGDDDLENVYQFIQEVLKDNFMSKQIIGIQVKPKGNFDLNTRMGNQIIEFGILENIEAKIKKLKAFYQKMEKDNSIDKYRKINIEFSKQIVCTK
jgi:cell division protein FtsQ